VTAIPKPETAADGFGNHDPHEPLVDARIRPLLERYASMVGAELVEVGPALVELRLPNAERKWFRNRSQLRIAFTLDALEREPEAEIAVIGSAFVDQLVTAIRSRGSRAFSGKLSPEQPPGDDAAELTVPITNGTAGAAQLDVAWHKVVRLLARVVVRAGSEVEEHLLESKFIDAATGIAIPEEIATKLAHSERSRSHPEPIRDAQGRLREGCASAPEQSRSLVAPLLGMPDNGHSASLAIASARPIGDIISIALAALRAGLEPKVTRLRDDAQRRLQDELLRIDRYYETLISDAARVSAGEATDNRAIDAEYARRRGEEERRHQVRAVVHPVQLTECELLVQRAQWELVSRRGVRASLIAQRWLNGSGDWTLACPECNSTSIRWLSVCKSGHVACDRCAFTCGVCNEDFCWDHGITACHVDGHPTCAEHARTCVSCHEPYCSAHEATCSEGEHLACSECVQPCAICGRAICEEHATLTALSSPRGQRRLCGQCVQPCEGGRTEHVGIDEVERCVTCMKYVCEHHRSTCAVDQSVHCSTHLRRTDASRRLVCETHREDCAFEPGAIFASDEIAACTSCGEQACDRHSHRCVEDGGVYCDKHALMLRNEPGKFVCRTHGAICHVDQAAHRLGQTSDCPVCAKGTCKSHSRACSWCGRTVCVSDMNAAHSRCGTCAQLRDVSEPADNLITAAANALGDRPTPKRWRTARDATHTVLELDLGWTRRVVLAVRHGDNVASSGLTHSAIGAKRLTLRS
jgi:hypothetical protein